MRLGPYELVAQIGSGGMGEVWVARRGVVGGASKRVAIKRLTRALASDPTYREILLEEARLSMLLTHSNIVHVFDAGEHQGEAYIAMELVDGLDLWRLGRLLQQTQERLPPVVVAYIIAEVLRGLAYAHELDHEGRTMALVHRDVSPHNVMLSASGEVKLTDFGVARLSTEDTSGTHVKGKARYMPPEQLRGDSRSPTVDLFAVGAVLQELLDGHTFRGDAVDDARLLGMAIDGVVPPLRHPDEVPPALAEVRARLLVPVAADRIQSAREALELLYAWEGFRNVSNEIARLVARTKELHAEALARQGQATGLELGPTFLHTNDALELDGALLEEMPDHALLALANSPANEATEGGFGPVEDLSPTRARRSPAKTGPEAAMALDEAPPIEIDYEREGYARHVPTSPNPTVERPRPRVRLLSLLAVVAALGGSIYLGSELLGLSGAPGPEDPIPGPPQARFVTADPAACATTLDGRMDGLEQDEGLEWSCEQVEQPFAALASGKAEFALTTLDEVLRRRPKGKIVAILASSGGRDALVLDTAHHPEATGVAALFSPVRRPTESGAEPALAFVEGSSGEHLARYVDHQLAAIDLSRTGVAAAKDDPAAVFRALEADDSPVVAGVLPEPWVSKAEAAGMKVALTAGDLRHALVEVLVASESTLSERRELVDAVVAAHYAGVAAQRDDPGALIESIARSCGTTTEEAKARLLATCTLDASQAASWLVPSPGGRSPLVEAIADSWWVLAASSRVVGAAPDPAALFDRGPLEAAATTSGRPGASTPADPCGFARTASTRPGTGAVELGPLELPPVEGGYFLADQAALRPEAQAALDEIADALRRLNPATIEVTVVGLGDRSGNRGRKLGRARAQLVVEALAERKLEIRPKLEGRGAARDAEAGLIIELRGSGFEGEEGSP